MHSTSMLTDRVAVVTGGSRGVGREIARALAGHGAAVAIVARDSTALAETARLIEDESGRRPLIDRRGRVPTGSCRARTRSHGVEAGDDANPCQRSRAFRPARAAARERPRRLDPDIAGRRGRALPHVSRLPRGDAQRRLGPNHQRVLRSSALPARPAQQRLRDRQSRAQSNDPAPRRRGRRHRSHGKRPPPGFAADRHVGRHQCQSCRCERRR